MDFPWLALGASGTAAIAWGVAMLTRRYDVAAIAGGGVILFLHSILYFDYTSDDAYISYRDARNFADGLGLVWNPGEWVEGYSNFLWTLMLAGFAKAGADLIDAGRWAGFSFAVATIAGTYRLTRVLLPSAAGQPAGLAAALLLAAAGSFAVWASAGLETSMFAALIVGAVLLHIREQSRPALPLSAAVWALACMTRPDGIVLFAVSGVAKVVEASLRLRSPADKKAWRREALHLATFVTLFAVLFVPYFVWRYVTYDWFFPNTYYAKIGGGIDSYDRGLRYTSAFLREYAIWLVLLAPVAFWFASLRRDAGAYVLALLVAWTGYVIYAGGDSLVRFRFFAPLMPLAYALIAASAGALIECVRFSRPPPRAVAYAAPALLVAGFFALTLHGSTAGFGALGVRSEREAVIWRGDIGRWLREEVPDDTLIAVIAVGAVSYESRLPTIDMLGINDEHIAHADVEIGTMAAGHEKYDSEYVLDREPDIIILSDGRAPTPWVREDYDALRRVIIPAIVDMVTNERVWAEYQARSVEIREGEWFNLLVRRGESALLARTLNPEDVRP